MIFPVTAEWNQIQPRGEAMNGSKAMKPRRALAMMAMLFGTILMTMLPAFGQQEVDPTYYDPWGTPKAEAVKASKPRAATKQQAKAKSASTTRVVSKVRVKPATARTRPS
jgi:hypothetical protein